MPINYLNLQPQIKAYCDTALQNLQGRPEKISAAIEFLHRFSSELRQGLHQDLSKLKSKSPANRCARPASETVDSVFQSSISQKYNILASDGSQISSTHHDPLPVSLINTSTVYYQPESGSAPKVSTLTEFIRDANGAIATRILSDSFVNTSRDIRELMVLANFTYVGDVPLITLSDGPLELYQEPREDKVHKALFEEYKQALYATCEQGWIMAGYTDKPRANLVIHMLELIYQSEPHPDLQDITDANIFSTLLEPGCRSAVFTLNSPSSSAYPDSIALHFFYLNVGTSTKSWIVRVEITQCTAVDADKIELLQHVLLEQCRLLGDKPYPYILHRAHEEAVVRFDERDAVTAMLTQELLERGFQTPDQSNKSFAKGLEGRTRLT